MNGPAPFPITDEQLATAKRMRARNMSFRYIAGKLGVPYQTLRNRLDPDFHKRNRERRERERKALYASIPTREQEYDRTPRNPRYDPRRDEAPVYRSEFAELMGEPPVGRSALDALALAPRDPNQDRSSFVDRVFGCPPD